MFNNKEIKEILTRIEELEDKSHQLRCHQEALERLGYEICDECCSYPEMGELLFSYRGYQVWKRKKK